MQMLNCYILFGEGKKQLPSKSNKIRANEINVMRNCANESSEQFWIITKVGELHTVQHQWNGGKVFANKSRHMFTRWKKYETIVSVRRCVIYCWKKSGCTRLSEMWNFFRKLWRAVACREQVRDGHALPFKWLSVSGCLKCTFLTNLAHSQRCYGGCW